MIYVPEGNIQEEMLSSVQLYVFTIMSGIEELSLSIIHYPAQNISGLLSFPVNLHTGPGYIGLFQMSCEGKSGKNYEKYSL